MNNEISDGSTCQLHVFCYGYESGGFHYCFNNPAKHNCACIDSITPKKTSLGPAAMYSVCAVSNFHVECVYSLAEASARIAVPHQYAWLV